MSIVNSINIPVPDSFEKYKEPVVIRLSYLESDLIFSCVESGIRIESSGELEEGRTIALRETVFHQLYRERIYQETLPIRKWLNSDE